MRYTVYEWHHGDSDPIGYSMTFQQIMVMDYKYIKFNKEKGIAWVSNCCDFKCH